MVNNRSVQTVAFDLAKVEHLLPTDEDIQFYREKGYYKSKKLFTDEQIDGALQAQEEFYAGNFDFPPLENGEWHCYVNPDPDVLKKNDYASFRKAGLQVLTRSPLIGLVAAKLSGAPSIRLWHDQLLYKPPSKPGVGTNVGWHTDFGYWKTCTSNQMLTAWVPFHDCSAEMGTISMIPGSHLWPDNTSNLDFFNSNLDELESKIDSGGAKIEKVPVELKKGEVSFHHCLTIHGSGPNMSSGPRRSIAIHLQHGENQFRKYTMPDGTLAGHCNDALCRQIDGHPDYSDPDICPSC
jgi:hypothetical protein